MRRLVLVTRQFPYGKSETFLETEIKILSKYFTTIIIYPSTKSDSIRHLPENVLVNDLIANEYAKKSSWLFKTLISPCFYSTFLKYSMKLKSLNSAIHLLKYCTSFNIYAHCIKKDFNQYDNVVVYSYWFSAFVDAAIKTIDLPNVVTRVHRGDLYEEFSKLGFFPYRGEVIKRVAAVFSISSDGERYLKERYNSKNIIVSRLGVNNYSNEVLQVAPPDRTIRFVSASNVILVKNVDFIAQNIVEYARQNSFYTVKWTHFGDGELLNMVKKIVGDYEGKNLLCEFPGRVSNNLIYQFYELNRVDLFLNLSDSEGIPVSIMEAISFGIPIVATDVGGVSEIVNDFNGVLLTNNPAKEQVIQALDFLLNKPKNRKQIKNFWFENYSADNNYAEFSKLLNEFYLK